MGHEQVPENRAEALCVGGDVVGEEGRDDDAGVRDPLGIAAVPADDGNDGSTLPLRQVHRSDQVGRHATLLVPTTHRENQEPVVAAKAGAGQPVGE